LLILGVEAWGGASKFRRGLLSCCAGPYCRGGMPFLKNHGYSNRYVRSTPVRLAEALERMEASVEPPSDVAESPHATELR
jgi:hypothetical protein